MSEGWSYYLDFDNQVFELKGGELAIGRSRACDIPIKDPSVSRRHVLVKADAGRILVKDLGSSNGTFVNGGRIEQGGELHNGDSLMLGDAELKARVVGESAFETRRLPAQPVEQHGDATLFLQHASAKLAQEAIEHRDEPAPAHMAPPPVQPAVPVPSPPESSHMAPPPVQPAQQPTPIRTEVPTAASPLAPAQPVSPEAPPPVQPAAPAPAAPPAPAHQAPQPAAPQPAAPQPAAPQPLAPQSATPLPATPQPATPLPVAPQPPLPQPPLPQPPPPQPPAPPPIAAAGPGMGLEDVRLDQTTGDLLPSLDGFDATMGPEMLAALRLEAEEKAVEAPPVVNPYSAPVVQQPVPAGFGIRLLATIIDLVWMLGFIVAGTFAGQQVGSAAASVAGSLIVLFGWAIWGATPGKSILKLHVSAGNSGQAGIGFPRAMARMVGYVASGLLLGIGFLMIAFSSSKRGLHDHIAGTTVQRQT